MATALPAEMESFEDAVGLGCAKEFFKEHDEVYGIIDNIREASQSAQKSELTLNRFWYILDQYQEQPHLLDPYLEGLLGKLLSVIRNSESSVQHLAFKFLYVISKVRKHKVIIRYMPHEVNDLQFILKLLSQQDPSDKETWQTRYMLLIWLSIVVMIPFHLSRMDALVEGNTAKSTMDRIMDIVKFYLQSFDSTSKAAVALAGKYLTRPDSTSSQLKDFIDWTLENLSLPVNEKHHQLIAALANLFKHGKREDMIPFAPTVLKFVLEKKFLTNNFTLVRKMTTKLVQRIGLTFLKIRIAPWRYSRGTRSLAANLSSTVPEVIDSETKIQPDDSDYDIPDELEEIVELLLTGLRDADFFVRWSAAKGVGRVTGRLPKEMADDVVVSILELFVPREGERSWHGGCLALAELGRRGLLLPQHLDRVIPIVEKALIFDENKGNFSVGSYIRDAACYLCWAFARAYEPPVLKPYIKSIAQSLLITALFDREVPCRRAASAAIQENVGRQGTFPNGIDIVTTVDYNSVSLMSHTFLQLSMEVAKFDEYTISLIDHLLLHKVNHWDIAVRKLASRALGNLTQQAPEHMERYVVGALLPMTIDCDYDGRHGAVLALAEIIAALGDVRKDRIKEFLDSADVARLRNIIAEMRVKKYFRGIGADIMREAACIFIERLSGVSFLDSNDQEILVEWLGFLKDCLEHFKTSVQKEAASALARFCQSYFVNEPQKRKDLLQWCLGNVGSVQQVHRQGCALAIGSLPKFMLENSESLVLRKLMECSSIAKPEEMSWVESRSAAVYALLHVISTIGVRGLQSTEVDDAFDCFFRATTEYVKDPNGDIAFVVRKAALESLKDLTLLLVDENAKLLKPDIMEKVMCALLRHCVEVVEGSRVLAIKFVQELIWRSPAILNIPHLEELQEILSPTVCEIMNTNITSDTFPIFVKVLDLKTYTYSVLFGVTCCIGSKTGSLIKHSQSAIQTYFSARKIDLSFLCECFLRIHRENANEIRFILPFLNTANFLLFCGALDNAEDDFLQELFTVSVKVAYLSRDVLRIMTLTGILSELLQFNVTRSQSLSYLVRLLYHQYSAVRKRAAEKLYEAVISDCEIVAVEHFEEVLTLLSNTNWATAKREDVKPAQHAVSKMLISADRVDS